MHSYFVACRPAQFCNASPECTIPKNMFEKEGNVSDAVMRYRQASSFGCREDRFAVDKEHQFM